MMSFGYARVLPGYSYVDEPGNPDPATFNSAANPMIWNGEWVSFTRTANNQAVNIASAPQSGSLLESILPANGMTPAAMRLAMWHALSIAHPDGEMLVAGDARLKESKARLKRLKKLLGNYDRRVGVADVREAVSVL